MNSFLPPKTKSLGMKNVTAYFNWNSLGIVIVCVLLGVIGYVIYTKHVLPITNPSFNPNSSAGSTGKTAEILFFSTDWCPHCKTAKPEWDQVKSEYDGKSINGYSLIFTDVNCTNESPEVERMMNTYKVEGFPTIKLLKEGQVIEYDAKPTKDTIVQFLNTVL